MIKIKFYGSLKRFGTDFQLDCQTVAEALKALMSQLERLRHMMQQGMYKVRIGSQYLDNRYLEKGLHYRLRVGMTVHFTPVLKGAKCGGVFGVITGIALIGAAVLLGPVGGIIASQTAMMLGGMGASMLLGGVAQMVEKEISVATEITKRTALTRTVTDANVNRLRLTLGVQALFEQNDQGDTHSATVEFKITVGTQQIPFTIKGKYNSSYSRAIIVENLPRVPFTIKVERITADSTSNRLANKTMWASYTEIIDAQFRYPNTAYMGVKFDSEYFNNIPTRTYEIYGIKVRVPSNYAPETRTYTGLWDGTFKVAYTNNPAWILMDVVTHKRYGLGDRLGEFSVDKWALYKIAQYCDQMIPDGFGGQEPRFTCNLWLTEQRSAYDVLSDLCSIFRAIPVWNGTELTFIMDRPSDPVWTYTNANVVGGQFSRQYSAMKARHNAIQVEYKDAENNYENTIEYISDDEQIRKFGLNLKKVTAFGCTSRGQAFRTGKWILETERLETETITFTVGSEGLMNIPGDIIRVSDNHFAGTNIGGRVQAIHGRTLTLDREIQFSANHFLSYINAQAKHQKIRITAVSGKQVTLESEPVGLSLQGVWSLLTQTVASQLYRCMTVTENEEGTYTIFALQHEPQKEAIVDNGASFEPRNTSVIKTPTLESLNAETTPNGLKLNWSSTAGVGTLTYDIKILKSSNLYAYHKGVSSTEFSTDNLPDGDYTVVVLAKNASGQMVSEKSQSFTINRPPVPRDVVVLGGLGNITISWAWVDEFTQTEIWVSEQDNLTTAQRLTKLTAKMYSHEVGAKQVRYYWLRHVRGQNVGAFYQQAGVRGESSVDIDKELKLLNEKLSQNIINEVFDTAAPARKLEMVKTVANLNVNQFQGVKQVYNERDGKLYRWDGSQYTSKIQASEIAGQLSQNQLDHALINQLTTAKDSAIQAVAQSQEAKRKAAALTTRVDGAEGKIAHAERSISTLNSTATTKFSQLEANLNSAKEDLGAKITAEQTARVNENKAQADELKKITASVNGATAQISTVSQVVADVKGQLTATHTIKTQTISGNHAAIAGISLGANKEQSSVIVMADKFQVVKNAQDGSPKSILSVVNDQIAINGDLIANGQITAAKLAAGAVRADHFAAGEISADKLAIGLGGNLFQNPIFANNGNGWTLYVNPSQIANAGWSFNRNTGDHQGYSYLETENQFHWQAARTNSDTSNVRFGGLYQDLKLVKGRYYCFSAYVGGHRSFQDLNIEQGEVQIIRKSWTGRGKNGGYDAGAGISSGVEEERRIYIIFKANGNANQNYRLIINQWAEGAQHNPMMKIRRPMLEECTEHTKVPSPWQNAGVTAIHGGSIVTNSITAQQIAANTITGNEIVGETIAGKHIASKSITAKKLYVENLSAISADLGNITGGSLNINNRFKVSNQGQVEMRAAAGNVGLVINNNQIIVYDERGNVRVKIGQL
ncbi:phage tail protein [Haemophilus parahaemolyticus]|uniref:TipJ family phage tail tip protein n=1 Tax=Haemophilus parahaemolyticus TaxID=735 RepID=UPI0028D3C423|nr:phage tail protein [Haemophilus parahaemolyticus]